jgi:replicative DNA helicase
MKDIRSELIGSLIKRTYQIPEIFPIAGFKDALTGPLSAVVPVLIEMFESKQVIGVSSVIRRMHEADDSISMDNWETILYEAVESANHPHKVGGYVEEIRNSLISKMILDRAAKIQRAGSSTHVSADALMDILEETTLELRSSIMSQDRLDSGDAIDEIARELKEYRETGEVPMIFTGLWELDRMIGGFGDGEYICISAMNGGGKSLLATGMMPRDD